MKPNYHPGLMLCMKLLVTFWIAVTSVTGIKFGTCDNETNSSDVNCLLGKVLKGYNKRLRPNYPGPPLLLRVEILLSNVFDVSEVKNEFGVEIYFRQFWNDPRLRLSRFNFTDPLFLNTETIKELWIPSTYFVKSKSAFRHEITTENVLLRISPNGDIVYSQRLSVITSCIMDLRYFPHDTQRCTLLIESYAYQDTDIIYSWGKSMVGAFDDVKDAIFDIPSFRVEEIILKHGINNYSIGNHSYLIANFKFQRRVGYFLIETYVPSCIVVIISWVSFWIPAESAPARVSLGITTVLTMTTISSAARQSLPKVSYVKVIDWFLLVSLVFVFAALLEYAFVVHYNSKLKEKDMMVEKLERLKQDKENYLRTTQMKLQVLDGSTDNESEDKESVNNENNFGNWPLDQNEIDRRKSESTNPPKKLLSDILVIPKKIDQLSRRGFPFAFISFLCIYWLIVTFAAT